MGVVFLNFVMRGYVKIWRLNSYKTFFWLFTLILFINVSKIKAVFGHYLSFCSLNLKNLCVDNYWTTNYFVKKKNVTVYFISFFVGCSFLFSVYSVLEKISRVWKYISVFLSFWVFCHFFFVFFWLNFNLKVFLVLLLSASSGLALWGFMIMRMRANFPENNTVGSFFSYWEKWEQGIRGVIPHTSQVRWTRKDRSHTENKRWCMHQKRKLMTG